MTALFMLLVFSIFAQSRVPQNIVGIWSGEDHHIKIEIYKAGPQYFGKQIWEDSLDEPDGTTHGLNNLVILKNIDHDGGQSYSGIFYDYRTGKNYKSTLKLKGSDVLKVRDYSVVSLFGKTTTWTRVQ